MVLLWCNSLLSFLRVSLTLVLCLTARQRGSTGHSGWRGPGAYLQSSCLLRYWWPCPVTPSLLRLSPSLLMIAQLEALNANLQVSWKWKSAKRWGQRLRNPGLDLGRVFISRRKASGRAGQSHLARMSQPPLILPPPSQAASVSILWLQPSNIEEGYLVSI